jgi:hypothetical protein
MTASTFFPSTVKVAAKATSLESSFRSARALKDPPQPVGGEPVKSQLPASGLGSDGMVACAADDTGKQPMNVTARTAVTLERKMNNKRFIRGITAAPFVSLKVKTPLPVSESIGTAEAVPFQS